MKPNKMAAVRELLSVNPSATPGEIVALLAKQKIQISEGVASNYKSVIKGGKRRKKGRKARALASSAATTIQAPANGSSSHGLEPAVMDLLKAGKELGWKKVRSIVELIDG